MRFAYPAVSILLGLTAIRAQQQQQNPSNNVTILQALNDTNSSPALKFVEFLQSSPDYQSILDILNDPSSNVTLFVPSDQVYYEATGQQPPAPAPVGNTNSTNATTPSTTAVAGGGPVASSSAAAAPSASSSSSDGGLPAFLSSVLAGRSSSAAQPGQPTLAPATTGVPQNNPVASGLFVNNMARYVKIPNAEVVQSYERFGAADASGDAKDAHSLVMRALLVERQQQQQQDNASDWKSVTTDAPFVDQFSFADLLTYHLVNGSIQLNDTQNATIVLNTFLTNSTVDKLGYGLPLLLQQQQEEDQQQGGQGQGQQNQTQGQGQQNQTQGLWQQFQQQVGGTSNSSNGAGGNWTVGSGLGSDANILTNETIQASNGMVYIIDKSKYRLSIIQHQPAVQLTYTI